MTAAIKIARWVHKKPMILIRFDEAFSEALNNSRQGFEHLTFIKPHTILRATKLPTVCIIEVQEQGVTTCYLATITRKMTVSLFDSRLTIKKLRTLNLDSMRSIESLLLEQRMKNLLNTRISEEGDVSILSPKLSTGIVEALAADPLNMAAFESSLSLLPGLRRAGNATWAQEDAIQSALTAFGLRGNPTASDVALKRGATSGLGLVGAYIYEDNVVHTDASRLPGFDLISTDVTGRAVFRKGDEKLVVYTANRMPLEQMLGVDLIYFNESRGNIVMVQYKMLEEEQSGDSRDWIFRPDSQLSEEISRMRLPAIAAPVNDYRLHRSPFFFKFVKRKIVDNSHQSFLLSLDHLNQLLGSAGARGPRGGIRLSYEALDGAYLREADMLGLIRSGYIGTHKAETSALATIIQEAANGNRGIVLAWQQKILEATA